MTLEEAKDLISRAESDIDFILTDLQTKLQVSQISCHISILTLETHGRKENVFTTRIEATV